MCSRRVTILTIAVMVVCLVQLVLFFTSEHVNDKSMHLYYSSIYRHPYQQVLKSSNASTLHFHLHTTEYSSTEQTISHPGSSLLKLAHPSSTLSSSEPTVDGGDKNTGHGRNNVHCTDDVCLSLLKRGSFHCYKLCQALAGQKYSVHIPRRCKFRSSAGHTPVALVSCPGSGNTWVRGLLEKSTGICTGSIYCDAALRNKGFVGEYVHDGSVLVVKTHTSDYQWNDMKLENRNIEDAHYSSAILLVRNPFDTFVTERHRSELLKYADKKYTKKFQWQNTSSETKDNSHLGTIGREEFGSKWDKYIGNISKRWQKTIIKWCTSNHSVLVVHYEDLLKDTLTEVERMLDFLEFEFNRTDVATKLNQGFEDFHRHHSEKKYKEYTDTQKRVVNSMIMKTIGMLKKYKLDHLFHISKYISNS